MGEFGIGASVRRKEDFRFLTGKGTYTDDINRPGQLHAYLLRSPHAHAEITGIDIAKAKAAPGVAAVFTGADLQVGGLPCGWLITSKDGSPMIEPPHPLLAVGKVRHVGDPVAVVIAETYGQAKDAAEQIAVGYKELPAVVASDAAIKPGSPQLFDTAPGNLCFDWHLGEDRKSTCLNSSHMSISYAVFCLKKKNIIHHCYLTILLTTTHHIHIY